MREQRQHHITLLNQEDTAFDHRLKIRMWVELDNSQRRNSSVV